MNMVKLKNYIFNCITLIISILIALLIINFTLIKISPQKLFPRPLAGSLPNILLTFYPDTYNKMNLHNYVAILGDSYAQGGGDAYLNGIYDYSIMHHLHKNDKKNYLSFARAGYGSISAVSNLVKMHKLSHLSYFIKDLNKPESIIFFFYEGNDLRDNIAEYNGFIKNNEEISDYTLRRINAKIKLTNLDKLVNNFPILPFIGELYKDIENLFTRAFTRNGLKEIKTLITSRIKKLFGHTIVLDDIPVDNLTWINSVKNHEKIKNIRPVQGAAIHLVDKEISIALEIFFESIKYIKSWSQTNKIYIVYLPSPISTYVWNEPIVIYYQNNLEKIKTTSNEKNNLNSIFIRNQIKNFSKNNGIEFLDTTDYIFEKGKNAALHGPLDWGHFNYEGYKNISNYMIKNISNN